MVQDGETLGLGLVVHENTHNFVRQTEEETRRLPGLGLFRGSSPQGARSPRLLFRADMNEGIRS
jgi:hypothetical protein